MSCLFRTIAVCAALATVAVPGIAAETTKHHRIAVQVNQDDPALLTLVLNNVTNLMEYYHGKGEQIDIEVVTYGPGLTMLRSDKSPVKDRIKRLKEGAFPSTLEFAACHNTMMGMEKREGHPIPIISEAKVVPSGVVRLMELQEQGWSYIRP